MTGHPLPHGHYQAQDLVRFRRDCELRGVYWAIKQTLRREAFPWSNWATLRAHAMSQEPHDLEYARALVSFRLDSEPADCVLMEAVERSLRKERWADAWMEDLVRAQPALAQQLAGRGSWLFNLFDDDNANAVRIGQQNEAWEDLWVAGLQRWAQPDAQTLLLRDQDGRLREEEILGLVFVTRMTLNLKGGMAGRGLWAIKLLDRLVGPGMIGTHGPGIPFARAIRSDVRRRVLAINCKHDTSTTRVEVKEVAETSGRRM